MNWVSWLVNLTLSILRVRSWSTMSECVLLLYSSSDSIIFYLNNLVTQIGNFIFQYKCLSKASLSSYVMYNLVSFLYPLCWLLPALSGPLWHCWLHLPQGLLRLPGLPESPKTPLHCHPSSLTLPWPSFPAPHSWLGSHFPPCLLPGLLLMSLSLVSQQLPGSRCSAFRENQ